MIKCLDRARPREQAGFIKLQRAIYNMFVPFREFSESDFKQTSQKKVREETNTKSFIIIMRDLDRSCCQRRLTASFPAFSVLGGLTLTHILHS